MKALKDYFNEREEAILDLLGKPERKFSVETFHELRVEIKKLNALADLLRSCSPNFKRKKTLKPFKLVFHQAGKVRELQLEEALFDKRLRLASSDYRKQLKKLRKAEEGVFFSMLTKRLVRRLKKKHPAFIATLSDIDEQQVNDYLEEKEERIIETLRQTPLQAPQIHEVRKLLKTFHYNRTILLSKKQRSRLKKDSLSPLMGQWHDCEVMIEHLQRAMISGGIEDSELRQLEKMAAKMAADRERLYQQLNDAIPASEFFKQ